MIPQTSISYKTRKPHMSKEKRSFFQTLKPTLLEVKLEPGVDADAVVDAGSSPTEEVSLFVESDDEETNDFEAFKHAISDILAEIPYNTIRDLYDRFKTRDNRVLLAIDTYLKGTEPKERTKEIPPILLENNPNRKRTRGIQLPFSYPKRSALSVNNSPVKGVKAETPTDEWLRYLGTIFSDAFATRPYMKPLPYLKKMSLRSLKPRKLTGKEKKRTDETAIVRLYVSPNEDFEDEREIGRLKEDMTRIIAPLLDFDLVRFEVSVAVETKKRLSIGDTFYVKIDCYLTNQAFKKRSTESKQDLGLKSTSLQQRAKFNFASETEGEMELRLTQHAVTSLFNRLQVRSVKLRGNTEISATQIDPTQVEHIDSDIEEEHEESQGELSIDQLQTFYSENQQSEMLKVLPETTNPPIENFSLNLRSYQRLGLSWMLAREKELEVLEMLNDKEKSYNPSTMNDLQLMEEGVMNPLWKTFKWPQAEDVSETDVSDRYFYGNMHSGELSLEKPLIKSTVKGGILADEMGLGKTISALALINSVPYDINSSLQSPYYANQTTLVIVPMSLLSQWHKEFEKANNNLNHKCIVYYGQQTVADLSNMLINRPKHIPIMMITTYGTVLNEFSKIESRRDSMGHLPKTGLYSVKFFRIIIDEGHQIRNRTNKTSRAIFELELSRKWVLTGTPIINRLDDLYSLVKFLELEPWNNFSYWKLFITLPFEQKQVKQTLDVIRTILEPIFLRRTKNMKGKDGKPLVEIPPKQVTIEQVQFSNRELRLYEWFKDKAYRQFNENLKSGELLRKYSQILTHILRLRQICCHPDLIKSVVNDMDEEISKNEELTEQDLARIKELFADSEADKFKDQAEMNEYKYRLFEKVDINNSECSICTSNPIGHSEMVITTCGHTFCLNCLIEHFEFQRSQSDNNSCPNCRDTISQYKLFKVRNKPTTRNEFKFHTGKEIEKDYDYDFYVYDPTKVSSKIQALINHIVTLKDQNMFDPVIVFSQFSSYLDIIENDLKLQIGEKSIKCLKFDGRLSEAQRQKLLQEFNDFNKEPERITVLLISLKAGGVGLNLTNASRAFMMDPWWSPSIEDQAIDRIHRIGQSKNVKVVRFIMENSIETNMLKIQERKKQLGEVVALQEEEKRKNRIEEIKILFES